MKQLVAVYRLAILKRMPAAPLTLLVAHRQVEQVKAQAQSGSLAAPTRSNLIGDHPSGLTKEQTRETMDHWQLGLGLGFCFRARVHCFSCLLFC